MNEEILKRILSEKKIVLPSLRNQDWKTVKAETVKINDLITNIPNNNITELKNLIYAGAKLVCEKVGFPLENKNKIAKPWCKIRLETQIRNLLQQAKVIKRKKIWEKEEKAIQQQQMIQLEKINQKVPAKEGRLKRYRNRAK